MKSILSISNFQFLFGLLALAILTLSCKSSIDDSFTNPRIKLGKVRITGRITDETKTEPKHAVTMGIGLIHPITLEIIGKEFKLIVSAIIQ